VLVWHLQEFPTKEEEEGREREREKERERERDPHRETVFRKPKISILREREREREFNQETMSITGVSRARPGDRP
jgi:hypothetical protein